MSRIITIGSGSSGNCYILECGKEKLIIELGVDIQKVFRTLDYNIDDVVGCLVSHIHKDHSAYIVHALGHCLPVYSCEEVKKKYKQAQLLPLGKKTQIGGFKVQPISVPHSCECYAFLIEHKEMGRLLFVTDCEKFGYKIKDLNHIFIEANWYEGFIIDNLCEGKELRSRYENHMELEDTIRALKANYSPSLQSICLVHLSSSNGDPIYFAQRVKEEVGFENVNVATGGVEVSLQLSEF